MQRMNVLWWSLLAMTLTLLTVDPARAAAGRTPGSFSVSPTGAATYSIPIWMPPGPRGIQPSLAIAYNSQAGDGILGPGWNLIGLSAVSRCNKTYKQDSTPAAITLVTTDGYCLNGNRLRLTGGTYGVAGSTYQTEIADFSNITASGAAGGGPASFTVQGKDGLIYEYGNTTDSRILNGATAVQWLLDKVRDRNGNNYIATYGTGAAGSVGIGVPLSISYTPSSSGASTYNYSIAFTYGTRVSQVPTTNDPAIVGYVNGTSVVNTNLLLSIGVSSSSSGSSTLVRKYTLAYGAAPTTTRARLTSVTECGGSAGTDCLPATTVIYQSGTSGVANPTTSTGVASNQVYTVDIDGDGKSDIVYATLSGSTNTWFYQLGTASGFASPVTVGLTTPNTTRVVLDDFLGEGRVGILASVSGTWAYYHWNGSIFSSASTGLAVDTTLAVTFAPGAQSVVSADVDGDGLPDLITALSDGNVYIRFNTASGGVVHFSAASTAYNWRSLYGTTGGFGGLVGRYTHTASSVTHVDFDGDGREDIVALSDNVTGKPPNQTTGYRVAPLLSQGTTFVLGSGLNSTDGTATTWSYLPVNWNNDACTDVAFNGTVKVSACNGSASSVVNTGIDVTTSASQIIALDWDGDGRTDLLLPPIGGGNLQVYLSSATSSATPITTTIPSGSGNGALLVMDSNGDGLSDILKIASNTLALTYSLHNGTAQPPDLVTSISDGLGMAVSPTYVSIAQNNYSKRSDGAWPDPDYAGPLYVVSQISVSDGIGGTYTNLFQYYGAHINLQGLGFDGFYAMRTQDSRNGTYRYQYYERDFPKRGMLFEDDRYQSDAATEIRHLKNTTAYTTLDGTTNNQRYFLNVSSATAQNFEVSGVKNGKAVDSAVVNYTYDGSGNAIQIVTTLTDLDSIAPSSPYNGQQWVTTVTSTIAPDTGSNWCLNLPTQTTVTKSSTTAPAITRTVGFTPDYVNCRMTQRIVEPSSSTYKVSEVLGFDGFGNVNSDQVTGITMPARTTTTSWGATGQFPMTIQDPLSTSLGSGGYQISRGYDFSQGVQTSEVLQSVTGGINNAPATSWTYDNFARPTQITRLDSTYTTTSYAACSASNSWCNTGNASTDIRMQSYFQNYDSASVLINQQYAATDGYGRVRFQEHTDLTGTWTIVQTSYDPLGRVSQQSMPYQTTTYFNTYGYDLLHRVTSAQRSISASNGTLQTTSYSYQGRTTVITDPQSQLSTKISQVSGSLGRSIDAYGYYQDFSYDGFGSLTKVQDSQSNQLFAASYDYGLAAFQRTATDMDRGAWSTTYNALGERINWSDAKVQNFSATYDLLSRPLTQTEPDSNTTWVYGLSASSHNLNQLQCVLGFSGTSCASTGTGYREDYVFDSAGRPQTATITEDGAYAIDFTYNTLGALNTLTYPTSTNSCRVTLQYGYQNGVLQTVTDGSNTTNCGPSNGTIWKANAVSPRGQVSNETFGNGIIAARVFDAVTGWPSSVQAGVGGGTAVQNESYLFDEVGNMTQRQDNNAGLTESFFYDNVYRLDHSTLGALTNLQMHYDVMGNITSRSDLAAGASWTYDPVKKHAVLQAGSNSNTYTYDANGNAITRNGLTIGWTGANYPKALNSPGKSVTLSYTPSRAHYQQVYTSGSPTETTQYVGGMLEKVTIGGVSDWRHYIRVGDQAVAVIARSTSGTNAIRYVLHDPLGSLTKISDSVGTVYESESYCPYGARRDATSWSGSPSCADLGKVQVFSREGFTGQDMIGGNSMNLVHLNGRVEDSSTGRLLSADPIVSDPGNTQSFNRYSYVNNNPLTMTDPTGFDTIIPVLTGSRLPGVEPNGFQAYFVNPSAGTLGFFGAGFDQEVRAEQSSMHDGLGHLMFPPSPTYTMWGPITFYSGSGLSQRWLIGKT